MFNIILLTQRNNAESKLREQLESHEFHCVTADTIEDLSTNLTTHTVDLLLVEVHTNVSLYNNAPLIRLLKEKQLPIITICTVDDLQKHSLVKMADDFIIAPPNIEELVTRCKRILGKKKLIEQGNLIEYNGLKIDLLNCEVSVDNKIIELTFKEYELLKLLANHIGRVFTREKILDKVWGYDYFGGDRTVDVHVRRLRSKIEDLKHTYIETVRNIGYRFKKEI